MCVIMYLSKRAVVIRFTVLSCVHVHVYTNMYDMRICFDCFGYTCTCHMFVLSVCCSTGIYVFLLIIGLLVTAGMLALGQCTTTKW